MKSQQAMQPNLIEAIRNLYYAAHWTPDRPVDVVKLWTDVRDAAGFKPGGSPVQRPFDGIQIEYSVDRLRQIGHVIRTKNGRDFGTAETHGFLLLHGQELRDAISEAVRKFLEEKLS